MATDALGVAASGLAVARQRLATSANNVANVNTDGFQASRVVAQPASGGGVVGVQEPTGASNPVVQLEDGTSVTLSNTDLITERINQVAAQASFNANLAVVRTADEMQKSLLDILA